MASGAKKPVSADRLTKIKCIITNCLGKAIIEGQDSGNASYNFDVSDDAHTEIEIHCLKHDRFS